MEICLHAATQANKRRLAVSNFLFLCMTFGVHFLDALSLDFDAHHSALINANKVVANRRSPSGRACSNAFRIFREYEGHASSGCPC
jgi:hypothetical protein